MLITDYQPFSIVENKGFRQFVKALNNSYELPKSHTISKTLIPAMYEKCFINTKRMMKHIKTLCLTTDSWKSVNSEYYMTVTIHFIHDFIMKSIFLGCFSFEPNHGTLNLASKLKNIVNEWHIEDKIVLAVSDNDSNTVNAMVNELNWNHFNCFAHTLNMIVRDSLKYISSTLDQVNSIAMHFNSIIELSNKFLYCQKNMGIDEPKKLLCDDGVWWNSTYHMLERFLELEGAINSTFEDSDLPLANLAAEEWLLLKNVCEILQPFESVTKTVSAEHYMSGSLIIVLTTGLLNVCTKLTNYELCTSSQYVLQELETGLQFRLSDVEYNETLAMSTFLDPRFKSYPFRNNDAFEKIKCTIVDNAVELMSLTENTSAVIKTEVTDTERKLSVWDSIDEAVSLKQPSENKTTKAGSEVKRYIEAELLKRNEDPLKWWSKHDEDYPRLCELFKTRCCVLASSVPCERLFSKYREDLNQRRARLNSETVEQILFLNGNTDYIN